MVNDEDVDDDDLPESPLHTQKAQSVDVDNPSENTRAASSKTSTTSVANVPGPSSSKIDESYRYIIIQFLWA